jgi:hypothetical protein
MWFSMNLSALTRFPLGLKDWEVGIERRPRERVDMGQNSENRAAGARFQQAKHGEAWNLAVGTWLGWGKPELKDWEAEIKRRARGRVDMGQNAKNGAAGTWFLRTKCGKPCIWVLMCVLGLAKPGLRWWGHTNGPHVKGGEFERKCGNRVVGARFL